MYKNNNNINKKEASTVLYFSYLTQCLQALREKLNLQTF